MTFLSLCLMLHSHHLLKSLSFCGHVQLQSVEGGDHLAHGQFDRLPLKLYGVTISFLEARRLVVLRGDWEGNKQTDKL